VEAVGVDERTVRVLNLADHGGKALPPRIRRPMVCWWKWKPAIATTSRAIAVYRWVRPNTFFDERSGGPRSPAGMVRLA
jgi:hypothetical protein